MANSNRKGAGATGAATVVLAVLLAGGAAAVQPPWLAAEPQGQLHATPAQVIVQDIKNEPGLAAMIELHRYATSGQPEQRLGQPFAVAGCCLSSTDR